MATVQEILKANQAKYTANMQKVPQNMTQAEKDAARAGNYGKPSPNFVQQYNFKATPTGNNTRFQEQYDAINQGWRRNMKNNVVLGGQLLDLYDSADAASAEKKAGELQRAAEQYDAIAQSAARAAEQPLRLSKADQVRAQRWAEDEAGIEGRVTDAQARLNDAQAALERYYNTHDWVQGDTQVTALENAVRQAQSDLSLSTAARDAFKRGGELDSRAKAEREAKETYAVESEETARQLQAERLAIANGTSSQTPYRKTDPETGARYLTTDRYEALKAEMEKEKTARDLSRSSLDAYQNAYYQEKRGATIRLLEQVQDEGDFQATAAGFDAGALQIPNAGGDRMTKLAVRYALDPAYRTQMAEELGADYGTGWDYLLYLNDAEKQTLAYYAGKGDWEKAGSYLKNLEWDLNARWASAEEPVWKERFQKDPVMGLLVNTASGFTSPIAYASTLGSGLENLTGQGYTPVDPNSNYMSGPRSRNLVREAFTDGKGDVARFLIDTGMSMADFLSQSVFGAASLPMMATTAAADKSYELAQQGVAPGKALALSTISGAVEWATEKLPLENLLDMARGGQQAAESFVRNVLKQVGTEASEELISEYAGNIAENAILGDASSFNQYIQELMSQGMSRAEAEKLATKQFFVVNPAMAALGGGLSGGVMGLGASAIGALTGPRTASNNQGINLDGTNQNMQQTASSGQSGGVSVAELLSSPEARRNYIQSESVPTQVNTVDNTNAGDYNLSGNGGAGNAQFGANGGFGQENWSTSGNGTGVPGGSVDLGANASGREARQGSSGVRLVVPLSPESQQVLSQRGVVNVELQDSSADNAAFSAALDAARVSDARNGWAVTPKTAQELEGTRTFMDANGTTGFAIAPDGDIEAVFSNKAAGAPKGSTKSTIPQAIANGGTKLDCYGDNLVKLYNQYGFVPVARTAFNAEYANPGWTPENGYPDIYFLAHNGDSADTVVQNYGQYKSWSKAELDALPVLEYDQAYAYRDSLMRQANSEARAINRYVSADGTRGRYVSPALIASYGDKPTQTYLQLTGQGANYGTEYQRNNQQGGFSGAQSAVPQGADAGLGGYQESGQGGRGIYGETPGGVFGQETGLAGYDWYNNDVNYGEAPRLIQSSQQGTDGIGAMTSAYPYQEAVNQRNSLNGILNENERQIDGLRDDQYTHEVVSDKARRDVAEQRLQTDLDGEIAFLENEKAWSSSDITTANLIAEQLVAQARETGDYSKVIAWEKVMSSHRSESGSNLQAWSQFARTPEAVIGNAAETLERAKKSGKSVNVNKTLGEIGDLAYRYDAAVHGNDAYALAEIIRDTSRIRNTGSIFTKKLPSYLETALDYVIKNGDVDFLSDLAFAGIQSISSDYLGSTKGEKISTVRRQAMLSKPATIFRNLVANNVFDPVDSVARNISVPLDMLLAKRTGQRSIAIDKSWLSSAKVEGLLDGLSKSLLEVGLDVDASGDYSKYESGSNRTFKMVDGPVSRLLSTWEKWLGYALTSTDQMQKGSIEAVLMEGLQPLVDNGQIKAEYDEDGNMIRSAQEVAQDLAHQEALYRTFQDENAVSNAVIGMRRAANNLKIPGIDIGVGDALMPFAQVPANLAVRAYDYSPVGLVKNGVQLVNALIQGEKGNLTAAQQAKIVQGVGRGMTGTGLIALTVASALRGVIRVLGTGRDENDKDKTAFQKMSGQYATQINLSAMGRMLAGKGAEWQDGDTIMNLDFLEPLNALITTGALISEDIEADGYQFGDVSLNALYGTIQSVLDLPVMETMQSLTQDLSYAEGDTEGQRAINAGLNTLADVLTSFVPNALAGIAQGTDSVKRDTSGEGFLETLWNGLKAKIPGLRQTLPEKVDSWGREMEIDKPVQNFLNTNILPGYINQYEQTEVDGEIERLSEETGESLYPNRGAPASFSADGEKITLTREEETVYQQAYGQAAYSYAQAFMDWSGYDDLPDSGKAQVFLDLENFAAEQAKQAVMEARGGEYEFTGTSKTLAALDDDGRTEYLAYREAFEMLRKGNGDAYEDLMQGFDDLDNDVQEALNDVSLFEKTWDAMSAGFSYEDFELARECYNSVNGMDENGKSVSGLKKQRALAMATAKGMSAADFEKLYEIIK